MTGGVWILGWVYPGRESFRDQKAVGWWDIWECFRPTLPIFLHRYFLCLPMNKTKVIPFLNKPEKIRVECGRWTESHELLWAVNPSAFPHLKFWGKNSYLLSVPDHQLCTVLTGLLANLCLWLEMEAGVKKCWWFWIIQLPIRKAACHRIILNSNALYPFMPWDASVQCRCSSSVSHRGTKSNWRISPLANLVWPLYNWLKEKFFGTVTGSYLDKTVLILD